MGGYNVDKNAGLIIGDGDFSVIGGTLDVTENGVYDVTTYKNVDVDYNVKNEDVTVTPELYEQEITPSAGYDGLGVVRVKSRPINLQSKQVAPSELTTFVTADEGYDGLSSVTVDNVNAEQLGFEKEYYAEGHTFLGEEGTYNPFPEHSYGGIYITELGENDYPKKILVKDVKRAYNPFPIFFNTSTDAKRELREFIFENCTGVTSLVQSYFSGLNYLQNVVLQTGITSTGSNAFYNCSSLQTINLPSGITNISQSAFQNCGSLTEISLPNSLTSISARAFQNCGGLTEISLPNSLTSIDAYAFQNCERLTEISLPNSLTSIGGWTVFGDCTSLTNLTLAQGFNCNGLDVSSSTRFTAETIVACLEALADRTGQTAYTIKFGTRNINKLTPEQIAIATNKNWNLN